MTDLELFKIMKETTQENNESEHTPHIKPGVYKLGEIIGPHNIKYWGQLQLKKRGMTAMFICPICDNVFRHYIYQIKAGNCKSCGCKSNHYKEIK